AQQRPGGDEGDEQPVEHQPPRKRRLRRVERPPEPPREHAVGQRLTKRPDVAFGVMLEEVRMQPPRRIAKLVPVEAVAALRTAWVNQAAEVVVAQGADELLG